MLEQGHAVIVVAEGAGQEHVARRRAPTRPATRACGDIQTFLQDRITDGLRRARAWSSTSSGSTRRYAIRCVPANPYDSVYCVRLAHAAVHAGMAGRTEVVVGRWHGRFVHIPIGVAISRRSTVDPNGDCGCPCSSRRASPRQFSRQRMEA